MIRFVVTSVLTILMGLSVSVGSEPCQCGSANRAGGKPALLIVGNVEDKTITFTPDQFAGLEPTSLEIEERDGSKAVYRGVPLGDLLARAGVDFSRHQGNPQDNLPLLSYCVLVDATDGYQVVFSLAEVDPRAEGPPILVASHRDGKPLEATGPFQIVEPNSPGHGRWVRQVARILIRPVGVVPRQPSAAEDSESAERLPAGAYLVGLGPGDPDLVTVRARHILGAADRVYCFHWLKEDVSRLAEPHRIEVAPPYLMGGRYLGVAPGDVEQSRRDEVVRANAALDQFAAEVRRLVGEGKGVAIVAAGDPTIYSPWGWTAESFTDVKFDVIPGISSFNAANAALEHGAVGASYVMLSAGHELPVRDQDGRLGGVLVLFTHTAKLPQLLTRLESAYPGDTPVAIVCDASYPTERVIRRTLGSLRGDLDALELPHLYLLYVGDGLQRQHDSP
jgi:precorrin-4 methylase